MLTELSANHPILLNMGESILISVSAVPQEVTRLTAGVKFPHLDVPVHRGEGGLAVERDPKACFLVIYCMSLTFASLHCSHQVRDPLSEP